MAQTAAPPNWGRWQGQYQQNQEYSLMETSGLVQYDPRVPTSTPLPPQQQQQQQQPPPQQQSQQPPHSSQYNMGTTYGMSSVPSMAPQTGFAMHNYTPSSPTPVAVQYRSYPQDRSPVSEGSHEMAYQQEQRLRYRESGQGPVAPLKREPPQMPSQRPLPPVTKQTTTASNIDAIKTEDTKFESDSPIDRMMKAIQQGGDEDDEGMDDEDMNSDSGYHSSPPSDDQSKPSPGSQSRRRTNKKKMKCTFPGCKRTCNQKTHLRIHMRKHTGDKPYVSNPL
jgi:hypothetical protein